MAIGRKGRRAGIAAVIIVALFLCMVFLGGLVPLPAAFLLMLLMSWTIFISIVGGKWRATCKTRLVSSVIWLVLAGYFIAPALESILGGWSAITAGDIVYLLLAAVLIRTDLLAWRRFRETMSDGLKGRLNDS